MDGREKDLLSAPPITIALSRYSYEPFVALLQEGGIDFIQRPPQVGITMNAGLEIAVAAVTAGLVKVIVAFLKARESRRLIITTKGNKVVHFQAEGLNPSELERLSPQIQSMMVIQTKRE
jgi:hypothetical protein